MKGVSYLITFLFLVNSSFAQSFNELSFKSINGDSVRLSGFAGKKVVFVIAPLSQNDSSFSKLHDFKSRYNDSIQIIGVLSFEDGYQNADASAIQALYANSGIILTEGMYTKKTSGAGQSALMKWLTDKNKNGHFGMDARGIGHKFFVTGRGRLYAVMPPQVSFTDPIIDTIAQSSTK